MKKFTVLVMVLLVALSFTLAGCEKKQNDGDVLKIGVVVIGSKDDKGYTYAHVQGMNYVKEKQGNKVEIIYRDNVDDGDDAASLAAIESLINEDGCTVIFTNSFGFMNSTETAANKYPNVKFLHCSGYKSNDTNFMNYFGRIYQARYLSGIAAGKATKTNKIGYVAAHPIPEVIRGLNAFTLGVRSVNPDATVQVVWTNTWYNPSIEYDSAKSLIEAGCDVIAQHQDTTEPVRAAKENNVYSVGYDAPMKEANPEYYLTAPIWNWGVLYNEQVEKILNGTWKPENIWAPMSTGVVDLEEFGPSVEQATKDLIAAEKAKIVSGEKDVFWGPIKDNKGNIKVAEGEKMTDEQLLSFDWLVEGVVGTIPEA